LAIYFFTSLKFSDFSEKFSGLNAYQWQLWGVSILEERQSVIFPEGEVGHVYLPPGLTTDVHREVLDAHVYTAHLCIAIHQVKHALNRFTCYLNEQKMVGYRAETIVFES
jgi:hypothetical protein